MDRDGDADWQHLPSGTRWRRSNTDLPSIMLFRTHEICRKRTASLTPPAGWSKSPTASEAVHDGRIYIELINNPFLNGGRHTGQYRAALDRAVTLGWLWLHESGTYVKFFYIPWLSNTFWQLLLNFARFCCKHC